jgi:UDP-N-acetylglucosamine:LPS N-acetylglucosamine transferase
MKSNRKSKVLFVGGGGGFAWETRQILERFDNQHIDYIVIFPSESYEYRQFFEEKNTTFINSFTHRNGLRLSHIPNFFRSLYVVRSLFLKNQISTVIGMGSSLTIVAFIVAKFYGCGSIFIESITRTDSMSKTGRLLLKLKLVRSVIVQWPEVSKMEPRAVYRGNIL